MASIIFVTMQIFPIQSIDGENNSFEPVSGKKKDGLQEKVLMICLEVLYQQYNPYESSCGNTLGFSIILTRVLVQVLSLLQSSK